MILIENQNISGWEAAVRRFDGDTDLSILEEFADDPIIGEKDIRRMFDAVRTGDGQDNFMKFITVSLDITAPMYWWRELELYGVPVSSYNMIHDVLENPFTEESFSFEHSYEDTEVVEDILVKRLEELRKEARRQFKRGDKSNLRRAYLEILKILPVSWNQEHTVVLSYADLKRIYLDRYDDPLQEWRTFISVLIEDILPLPFLITGDEGELEEYIYELNQWREDDD